MNVFYSARYEIPLPGHIWPTSKYRLIAERLLGDSRFRGCEILEPPLASWDDLALVHTAEYLEKIRHDRLTADEIATLELPWGPGVADGFRLMVGGTCATAAAALDAGAALHLGGGLHHAFANHGEGFCLFNDVAVAIRALQHNRRVRRAAVLDCDVHHGNGTAMIFDGDDAVFSCSIHQQHNYPSFKPRSDLDVGLRDGAGDGEYLTALRGVVPAVLASRPEVLFYLAGADPFVEDRLGGLAVTKAGLRERDRVVIGAARDAAVPLVVALAGGYAVRVEDTVDVHVNTAKEMLNVEC